MHIVLTNALIVLAVIAGFVFTGNALCMIALLWLQGAAPPAYCIPKQPGETSDAVGPIGFVNTDDE